MACSDYDTLWRHLADFSGNSPVDAIICPFTDSAGAGMGMGVFALLVFGGIGLSYAVYQQSIAPLFVAAIFCGPVFMVVIPSTAVRIVVFFAMITLTAAGYVLYQRSATALR